MSIIPRAAGLALLLLGVSCAGRNFRQIGFGGGQWLKNNTSGFNRLE